jgi:hypothetical protein
VVCPDFPEDRCLIFLSLFRLLAMYRNGDTANADCYARGVSGVTLCRDDVSFQNMPAITDEMDIAKLLCFGMDIVRYLYFEVAKNTVGCFYSSEKMSPLPGE